jgi:hypothetical protein
MSKQNEPAFPVTWEINGEMVAVTGMTMRQWYKGQLVGSLTKQCVTEIFEHKGKSDEQKIVLESFTQAIGMIADALVVEDAAREREE